MGSELIYVIGQILGFLAMIFGFISFQQRTQLAIIGFQFATGLAFSAHYFCIGAMTAVALNLLSVFICVVLAFRNKRNSNSKAEAIICSLLMVVVGIFAWENIFSIFLILGLIVNNFSLSFANPQNTRRAVFLKSPLCMTYNIAVFSIGGIIFEILVITSAIIGLIKYSAKKQRK